MSKAYVKNTRRYDFHIPLNARETITFRCRTVDPANGSVVATGYTPVSDEQAKKLAESAVYQRYIKKGFFEEYNGDAVPSGALLDSDLAAALAIENVDLKAENAALKEALAKYEEPVGKSKSDEPNLEGKKKGKKNGTGAEPRAKADGAGASEGDKE